MKVLYLTQWYPNRYDAMAGLFVRNHAEAAVKQGVDVCVLYCHETDKLAMGAKMEMVDRTVNGVREIIVYYIGSRLYAVRRGYQMVEQRWGRPDLCQVNVLTKTALWANLLWRNKHIPYILVEHWSGYLPANGTYLRENGKLKRWMFEYLAREAKCLLVVSAMLRDAMADCGIKNKNTMLINNVIDDCFFAESDVRRGTIGRQLLHVSCFDEAAKNIRGILKAVSLLRQRRQDFHLTIVGTGKDFDEVKAYADELGLTANMAVTFTGELTPQEVHETMLRSHVFVLFSRYETAGVVYPESLAAGVPIVSTLVGIASEVVTPETGIIVPQEDTQALAEAIENVMDKWETYDASVLREKALPFSSQEVGAMLKSVYESVLS